MARVPGILILASLSFLRVTRPSLLEEGRSNSLSVDNMIIRLIVGLATVQERIQFVKECVTSSCMANQLAVTLITPQTTRN